MHHFLLSDRRTDVTCTLNEDALVWGEAPYRQALYAEIRYIRLYGSPGWTYAGQEVAPSASACDVAPLHGRRLNLVSKRPGCDRTSEHRAFVSELLHRVALYPNVIIYTGMSWPLWLLWVFVFLVMSLGFAFSTLALIVIIVDVVSGARSTPLIGALSFALFFAFTGVGTFAIWRIIRIERPRRRPASPPALPS